MLTVIKCFGLFLCLLYGLCLGLCCGIGGMWTGRSSFVGGIGLRICILRVSLFRLLVIGIVGLSSKIS